MAKPEKMHYCFNCGEELGCYSDGDQFDTCGKQECNREARNQVEYEREEAHDALDERMGWR